MFRIALRNEDHNKGGLIDKMNDYKNITDTLNNAYKNIMISNKAMNQLTEAAQSFYRSMEIMNPTWISLSQQIQSEFSKAVVPSMMDSILEQQERIQKIFASTAMNESLRQMELSMAKTAQIANAASSAIAAISATEMSAIRTLNTDNIVSIFSNLELSKLNSALADSLQEMPLGTTPSIETLANSIADHYEADTDQEKSAISGIKQSSNNKKLTFSDIISLLALIIAIYEAALSTYSQFLVKTAPQNETNIVQYVNNFYISNENSAANYNDFGLRIINRQTVARIKPDCSSKIEGKLSAGTIVSVIDKYRKWIEVSWSDEEGNSHSGWIQNYKVSEFKEY